MILGEVADRLAKEVLEPIQFCTDMRMVEEGRAAARAGLPFAWPVGVTNAQANDYRAGFVRGREVAEVREEIKASARQRRLQGVRFPGWLTIEGGPGGTWRTSDGGETWFQRRGRALNIEQERA